MADPFISTPTPDEPAILWTDVDQFIAGLSDLLERVENEIGHLEDLAKPYRRRVASAKFAVCEATIQRDIEGLPWLPNLLPLYEAHRLACFDLAPYQRRINDAELYRKGIIAELKLALNAKEQAEKKKAKAKKKAKREKPKQLLIEQDALL